VPNVTHTVQNWNQDLTSCTVSGLTPTGTNRLGLVHAWCAGLATPSSVTVGGNAATLIDVRDDANGDSRIALYYYINPAASSQDVVVTYGSSRAVIMVGAVALDDSHQTTPIRSGSFRSDAVGDGLAASVSVPSATGDLVVAFMTGYTGSSAITPNNTEIYEFDPEGSFGLGAQRATGAASVTATWSALTGGMTIGGFSVQSATGGGSSQAPRSSAFLRMLMNN
jgi:hypothetical protein